MYYVQIGINIRCGVAEAHLKYLSKLTPSKVGLVDLSLCTLKKWRLPVKGSCAIFFLIIECI